MTTLIAYAQIPDRTDPAAYTCSEFIGAGAPVARERAERMVYWIFGYVRARLDDDATIDAQKWRFDELAGHINLALFEHCRSNPGAPISEVAISIVDEIRRAAGR